MNQAFFSHIAIAVPDLHAAVEFYCGAFDFQLSHYADVPPEFPPALGRETMTCKVAMLLQGDRPRTYIELIKYSDPEARPRPDGPHHTIGFTHIAFYVDSIDRTLELVEKHGGKARENGRIVSLKNGHGQNVPLLYCQDPFGTTIEIIEGSFDSLGGV